MRSGPTTLVYDEDRPTAAKHAQRIITTSALDFFA